MGSAGSGGKPSILELLSRRPVIGDGGYITELERRGYVKAGPWTPEVVVEHPQAGRERFCFLVGRFEPL